VEELDHIHLPDPIAESMDDLRDRLRALEDRAEQVW